MSRAGRELPRGGPGINAPGFDKHEWPNWSDSTWSASVDSYYGATRPGTTTR